MTYDTSLLNSTFSDVMLVLWSWPWWESWKMAKNQSPFFFLFLRKLVAKYLPAYHWILLWYCGYVLKTFCFRDPDWNKTEYIENLFQNNPMRVGIVMLNQSGGQMGVIVPLSQLLCMFKFFYNKMLKQQLWNVTMKINCLYLVDIDSNPVWHLSVLQTLMPTSLW